MDEDAADQVRNDPGLRQVLQAARAWGVSPRRFLGWEPARTTVYERDHAGRVVREITRTEAEWSDGDRALAQALASWEADLCGGCSYPLAETTLPENEGAYRAREAIRCHRCTASMQAYETYADTYAPEALMVPVELLQPVEG